MKFGCGRSLNISGQAKIENVNVLKFLDLAGHDDSVTNIDSPESMGIH